MSAAQVAALPKWKQRLLEREASSRAVGGGGAE